MSEANSILLILLAFFLYHTMKQGNEHIEVEIKQGKLKGTVLESRNGTKVYAFLSIPYAKPPVGKLRFEPPREPDSWNDVRDATVPPPLCIQRDLFFMNSSKPQTRGQEDCLYLNVYTQTVTSDAKLPVMVFIHGGSFIIGAGAYAQPHYLLDFPVVLVTLNYRLGVLGFLSAADELLPGNYGMKDQTAALKWVKQNIAVFGGNANKITIFGESAGGGSVHLHTHSPLSKGLFHRAIAQSGSALAFWAQTPPDVARQRAQTFGLLSGCSTKSTKALVDCLREIPAENLIETNHKFFIWNNNPGVPFSIVIESKKVDGAFLTENPWQQDVISDVPLMTGITSGEGAIFVLDLFLNDGKKASDLNTQYKRLFPLKFGYAYWLTSEKIPNVTESLRKYYYGDGEIHEKTKRRTCDLVSDAHFMFSSVESALRHTGPTYFYFYDHRNSRSINELVGDVEGEFGAGHSDDLLSLFPSVVFPFPNITTGPDLEVSRRMCNYWTNFAKYGNPNGEKEWWQPLKPNEFNYLHIAPKKDTMKKNLFKDRYVFWKNLGAQPSFDSKEFYTL